MHELDFSKGFAAIAYRDEVPWHGYGFAMKPGASIDEWRQASGLYYSVERRPINFETPRNPNLFDCTPTHTSIPGMRALVRSDNDDVLSVVGKNYKVVQPGEILEFFRNLVENAGFEIETAGALAGGKRVWALAKTGRVFLAAGDPSDRINAYLLLTTSYDKKFATTGQFTSIRVVCNNTLEWSLQQTDDVASGDGRVFRVPHNSVFKASEVQANLGILDTSWKGFETLVEKLVNTPISKKVAVEFFMDLMGYSEEDPQHAVDHIYTVKKLLQSYETAPGQQLATARNTAWGLVNAVTYFTDHTRRASNNGTRINSAWFGSSSQLKRKALKQATALAA